MIEALSNNLFVQKMLLVILITILPIVPSYILFKFLPSESFVTGPFKGLQIDFSGATSIYFVIFISLIAISQFWRIGTQRKIDTRNYEVWKIKGKLKAENIENYQKERFRVIVEPQYYQIEKNGEFTVDILRKRDPMTGKMEFPKLYISDTDGDYMGRNINLDPATDVWSDTSYNIQRVDSINTITITKPIDVYPRPEVDMTEDITN